MKRIRFLLSCCLLLCSASALAESYAIVTLNKALPKLKSSQVKMIYRGHVSHIDNVNIVLLDLTQGSALRNRFYYTLLGKSPAQMQAIWARQTFSGRNRAPSEVAENNPQSVTNWLNHNKNGIAYIPVSWLREELSVLYVFDSEEPL